MNRTVQVQGIQARRRRELRADETKCSFGIFPTLVESDLRSFRATAPRQGVLLEAPTLNMADEVPSTNEQEESS